MPEDPQQPRYPDVQVQLSGEDGNAFAILGRTAAALPRAPEVAKDDQGQPIEWWIPWLEFLRQSATHGGTVVR